MADDEVPAEVVAQITAMLAEMQCEMDPSDIEAEDDGGYELDDVFCVDGQYDMKLDADLQITERRKE
ncbi:PepSY domain-containing protein [Rhodovulum sp.]|uniref:PepSY domain-containing protein n=1 Tax=Rhodovulum sp. TaxID=34009 RepID=UPI0039C96558